MKKIFSILLLGLQFSCAMKDTKTEIEPKFFERLKDGYSNGNCEEIKTLLQNKPNFSPNTPHLKSFLNKILSDKILLLSEILLDHELPENYQDIVRIAKCCVRYFREKWICDYDIQELERLQDITLEELIDRIDEEMIQEFARKKIYEITNFKVNIKLCKLEKINQILKSVFGLCAEKMREIDFSDLKNVSEAKQKEIIKILQQKHFNTGHINGLIEKTDFRILDLKHEEDALTKHFTELKKRTEEKELPLEEIASMQQKHENAPKDISTVPRINDLYHEMRKKIFGQDKILQTLAIAAYQFESQNLKTQAQTDKFYLLSKKILDGIRALKTVFMEKTYKAQYDDMRTYFYNVMGVMGEFLVVQKDCSILTTGDEACILRNVKNKKIESQTEKVAFCAEAIACVKNAKQFGKDLKPEQNLEREKFWTIYAQLKSLSEFTIVSCEKENSDFSSSRLFLILGETGTGKTLIANTFAQCLGLEFVQVDSTTIVGHGYTGKTLMTQINPYSCYFFDEFDKLLEKNLIDKHAVGSPFDNVLKLVDTMPETSVMIFAGSFQKLESKEKNILAIKGAEFFNRMHVTLKTEPLDSNSTRQIIFKALSAARKQTKETAQKDLKITNTAIESLCDMVRERGGIRKINSFFQQCVRESFLLTPYVLIDNHKVANFRTELF